MRRVRGKAVLFFLEKMDGEVETRDDDGDSPWYGVESKVECECAARAKARK